MHFAIAEIIEIVLDNRARFVYYNRAVSEMTEAADIMEWYRSGHNEHDWKSCDGQKPSEGSNPSHSAKRNSKPNGFEFLSFCPFSAPYEKVALFQIEFTLPLFYDIYRNQTARRPHHERQIQY